MVEQQRGRYLGGSDGAPPPPPPGGYRGARRVPETAYATGGMIPASADVVYRAEPEPQKRTVSTLGLIALSATVLFVLTMLLMMGAGGTDALYGTTMIVLQLIVLGAVVAAVLTPRGRMLGTVALAVTLVFNVATVGAMGALRSAATHAYSGTKSAKQLHDEAYPGIRDVSDASVLSAPSLEQTQVAGDRLMAEVRERLSREFGFTWVPSGAIDVGPERNGYGGESMLKRYASVVWTTEQPVHDTARKREVMRAIDGVLAEQRLIMPLYPLNEPGNGISDDMVAKLYGSRDPAAQHTWEYYAGAYPDPLRFYAYAYDLSKDPTGEFRIQREAMHRQTGEPLEGIQLAVFARQVLSDADRAEFEERLRDYPGY
ncbi:hypothetical protein [Microbacterium soli]|uniref:Uncharacterized protein n=1 Tax=Microbacterium soli TaxID=446075 RepID=A0ABP7N4J2_9MICO